MPQKPFDLDTALAELRTEVAPPEVHVRTRKALARPPRRPRPWRMAATAGTLAILVLPVLLRNRGGAAYGLSLADAITASKAAPYVLLKNYATDAKGKMTLKVEQMWAPRHRVEKYFFGPQSLREIRHLPGGRTFERNLFDYGQGFRSYETIHRSDETLGGTDEQPDLLDFDRIYRAFESGYRLVPMSGAEGERTRRFLLQSRQPSRTPNAGVWTVEWPSKRIRRMEMGVGRERVLTEIEYPASIDPKRLDVPPPGWTWPEDFRHLAFPDPGRLPRYDLDRELVEFRHLSDVGLRRTQVAGVGVKLVGLFQSQTSPSMPLFAVYSAGEPNGDGAHPARLLGSTAVGGLTTMKKTAPKILATVFPTGRPKEGKILPMGSVRIPVYRRPGEFVGYAEFRNVPVRQYSRELYSGLRVPSFH